MLYCANPTQVPALLGPDSGPAVAPAPKCQSLLWSVQVYVSVPRMGRAPHGHGQSHTVAVPACREMGRSEVPTCPDLGSTRVHTVLPAAEHGVDAGGGEHGNGTKQGAQLDGHASREQCWPASPMQQGAGGHLHI